MQGRIDPLWRLCTGLDQHIGPGLIALRFWREVHRVAIHQCGAATEVRVRNDAVAFPAHHFLRRRDQIDQCREAVQQVTARNLIPRDCGDIRMLGFLVRRHPRDLTEVNMAVDQAGSQE